jgi:hypothetical protein
VRGRVYGELSPQAFHSIVDADIQTFSVTLKKDG